MYMKTYLICLAILVMNQAHGQKVISRLEIMDIKTKSRTIVRQFDQRVEAPNWSPDGKFLVYNGSGQIFRIPVTGGEPELINTGKVKSCNNDHMISADGKMLYVSATGPLRISQVFGLPLSGGEPELITQKGPSYLHGVSPDGNNLAYCADRGDNFDVYVCPAKGGDEVRLTNAPGLDDGPEYSPDGKYIWFNSVRTGLMQAWRMKADGSDQKQMTFDEANSWFPHVSPDGKHVVVIAYKKGDVEPGSHPADKNVEIRLMSPKGGKTEVLANFLGGQGTINVNSWSPDSRRFAFVSYERVH
jgi:Tol biopolymer transport system component